MSCIDFRGVSLGTFSKGIWRLESFRKHWSNLRRMSRVSKLSWVFALIAIALGCDDPFEHSKCRSTPLRIAASPDRKFEAVVREDSCKPHLDQITQTRVELRRTKSDEDPFPLPGQTIFGVDGKRVIETRWLDSTHLEIECPGANADKFYQQSHQWDQIIVSYKL